MIPTDQTCTICIMMVYGDTSYITICYKLHFISKIMYAIIFKTHLVFLQKNQYDQSIPQLPVLVSGSQKHLLQTDRLKVSWFTALVEQTVVHLETHYRLARDVQKYSYGILNIMKINLSITFSDYILLQYFFQFQLLEICHIYVINRSI